VGQLKTGNLKVARIISRISGKNSRLGVSITAVHDPQLAPQTTPTKEEPSIASRSIGAFEGIAIAERPARWLEWIVGH
jgi:hypothetical protein